MAHQSEAQLEGLLIAQLVDEDYERVTISDYDALVENFKVQFSKFNESKLDGTPLSDKEWERLFNYMGGKSVYESACILRDKYVLERDDGTKIYLSFIDEDHVKNIFQVTNQTTVVGKYVNRYDVTLLVNGLPLVQIELKRRGMDIREAINQIMRYKRHSYNGLYRFIQMFIVSNGVDTKYFANTDRDIMYSLTFFWTDENNVRITNLKDFSIIFLARDHVIRMLTRYTILNSTEKFIILMRPYQVYATQALTRQATVTNRNAYIWHTTGSGKTITAFKTAQLLSQEPSIKKVIFLVDRKDLDTQTTEEFNKFSAGSVDATDNTYNLVKQMQRKDIPLIVTTIQKMSNAVKKQRYDKAMNQYRDDKVIFIIDECHRSQFGDMHKDIVKHFRNAQFFGFTGTPRFEINGKVNGHVVQTTKSLFGECLHSYLIKDAIFDKNVLGFHVEYIKTIEGDYDENDATLAKAINTDEIFMADERMTNIANHIIVNHKAKTRNQQYTAIFTVASIPMLIKYYDIFKSIDHDLTISGIFTYGANEDGEGKKEHSRDALERIITDYNKTFNTDFSTETFQAYHKDISDRVKGKKAKQLDILLVVNMFLTGFDSKPLDVLYVDKKLEYHDLLQAYSRTNRVEKETKPYGIVVCYRNLKKATDEALCLFSKTDDTGGILTPDFDYFVKKFNEFVVRLKQIAPTPAAIDTMQNEEEQKKFVVTFRELTKILLSLQTFVEFSFERTRLDMSDQEYQDYKSKYLGLRPDPRKGDTVSVLDDVDFCMELMESNRINVAYIMNLLRNLDLSDKKKRKEGIDHIRTELDRTDNPELRKKVDLLKAFLDQIEAGLVTGDIDNAYNDFEEAERQREIEEFCEKEELDAGTLSGFVSEYEFSGILNAGKIRDSIEKPLPFLKKKKLVNRIIDFIFDLMSKYGG